MADKKISELNDVTTPLAGSELLPIVQSSVTKKVASDDLTVKNIRSNATTGVLQVDGPATGQTRVMTVPDANFTAVGRDTTDTLTNKTVNLTDNTLTGTLSQFNTALSDGSFVSLAGTETLTNKTLTSPAINTPTIAGGTINNTPIGGTTASTGAFTTVSASSSVNIGGSVITGRRADIASSTVTFTANEVAAIATQNCSISEQFSTIVGGTDNVCSGFASTVIGSSNSTASTTFANVIGSQRTQNNTTNSLAMGTAASGSASIANRKIHLFGSNGNIYNDGLLRFGNLNWSTATPTGGWALDNSGGNLRIREGTADRMIVTSAGNVGIGTTAPAARLQVNPSGATRAFSVRANGNFQGTAQKHTIVRHYPVVSTGTKLIIPFISQPNLFSTTICKIIGHGARFNVNIPLGFEITFAVGHLNTMSNLESWGGNGNFSSIAINGLNIEITFTTAYTNATANGVFVAIEYMTNELPNSIDVANIAMN